MSVSQKIAELNRIKKKRGASSQLSFFRSVKEEMKKVSWTTKQELTTSAKIVIGAVFALGIGIYVVDLTVRSALMGIGLVVRFVG